jgi:protein-disulfide isomerase
VDTDGTTILVGDPAAPHSVTVEEDPRCPVCKQFEQANDAKLIALATAGKVSLRYVLASFIDNNSGGYGSHRAVNALRASVQENRFPAYHKLLFDHQPPESTDGFTTPVLLSLAHQVPGLVSTPFQTAVTSNRYVAFANRAESAFLAAGATGTPTVKIDGTTLTGADGNAVLTAAGFASVLARHGIH